MTLLERFLEASTTSLKICGYTRREDIEDAINLGVDAIGINFWPKSKRYCDETTAREILKGTVSEILRVGLFVNQDIELATRLIDENLIDIAQFHGDESVQDLAPLRKQGIPFIKALGIKDRSSTESMDAYGANAILLDAHAPGVYGGTGEKIDWSLAQEITDTAITPIILAGGITPENAAEAVRIVKPAALDTASGVETSPGIKNKDKVRKLIEAIALRSG